MEKGVGLLLAIFIFSMSFASSSYLCSDNSKLVTDIREIDLWRTKNAGGLILGIAYSDETSVLNRYAADVFVDALTLTLANGTIRANFTDGTSYTISLSNSTETEASIKIESSSGFLEEKERGVIGSLQVALEKSEGIYPGSGTADIMLGKKKISLISSSNPREIISFNGKNYLLELYSASDNNAAIKVSKCSNSSLNIIEIEDAAKNGTILNATNNQSSGANSSLNNSNNNTNVNLTGSENQSSNFTNQDDQSQNSKIPVDGKIIMYVIIAGAGILFFIVLAFFISKFMKKKSEVLDKEV
ncbi:MAG: hypothetical protein AABW50_03615 [Nanoarchaeota archaeon]